MRISRRDLGFAASVHCGICGVAGAGHTSTCAHEARDEDVHHAQIPYAGDDKKKGRRFFTGETHGGFNLGVHETILLGSASRPTRPAKHVHRGNHPRRRRHRRDERRGEDRRVVDAGSVIFFGSRPDAQRAQRRERFPRAMSWSSFGATRRSAALHGGEQQDPAAASRSSPTRYRPHSLSECWLPPRLRRWPSRGHIVSDGWARVANLRLEHARISGAYPFPQWSLTPSFSPAYCGGRRARSLLRADSDLPLARSTASRHADARRGVFVHERVVSFRGKLTYAIAFGRGCDGPTLVITPTRGLQRPDVLVDRARHSRVRVGRRRLGRAPVSPSARARRLGPGSPAGR